MASLVDLRLAPTAQLLLETRTAAESAFAEYNPNEMMLHVKLWDADAVAAAQSAGAMRPAGRQQMVVVEGEQRATVGGLRRAVAAAFGVPAAAAFWLVLNRQERRVVTVLPVEGQDDAAQLSMFQVRPRTGSGSAPGRFVCKRASYGIAVD